MKHICCNFQVVAGWGQQGSGEEARRGETADNANAAAIDCCLDAARRSRAAHLCLAPAKTGDPVVKPVVAFDTADTYTPLISTFLRFPRPC